MMPLPAVASAFPTLPHWPPSALPSKTPMLQTEVKCGLFLIIFFFFFFYNNYYHTGVEVRVSICGVCAVKISGKTSIFATAQ